MGQWSLTASKHLRNYQWKAIKFSIAQKRNAMFLDMGLGKTTITLHTIKALLHSKEITGKPVLILAPIRVIHNVWRQEAEKWEHTAGLRFGIMHGSQQRRFDAFNADVDILLMNPHNLQWLQKLLVANGYGTTPQDYDDAYIAAENERRQRWAMPGQEVKLLTRPEREWPFSMLVVDESSMFKSSNSQRWKILRNWAPLFTRATLLTGTPTPNTMLELWPQIYLLDRGQRLGRSAISFRDRYFYKADYMGYDYRLRQNVWIDGQRKTGEEAINAAVADIVMRLDAKDWLDIPPVLYNIIDVEMPEEVRTQYKTFEDKMFLELLTSDIEAISAASLTQRCHQFANGAVYSTDRETEERTWTTVHDAKLEALEDVLHEAGGNAIVAYQFRHDLERLRLKYPAAPVLGGGGSIEKDKQTIEEWNAGKHPVLLCHPASAGHGLNLQHGGHIVVFFSLTWSLEQHDQLIARLHRSGQTDRVMVHYLRTKDTVDELIFAALQSKARSQKELLDALREYSLKREQLQPKVAA
jgi:SNF2 family DNA or RNA helicase